MENPITLKICSASGAAKKTAAGPARENTIAAIIKPLISPIVHAVSK